MHYSIPLKKICLSLILSASLLPASAKTFSVNGIYYTDQIDGQHNPDCVEVAPNPEGEYENAITIPAVIIYGNQEYKVSGIGESAFSGNSNLTSVTFPESLEYIADKAFKGCSGLESLTIPESVREVGPGAFQSCSGLSKVKIQGNTTSLGSYAFAGCGALTEINLPERMEIMEDGVFFNTASLTEITLPASLVKIGDMSFANSSLSGHLQLPPDLEQIGRGAFAGNKSITSVDFPRTLSSIGISSFSNCTSLGEVNLYAYAGKLGENAFENCSALAKLELPEGMTEIPAFAFSGCSSLVSVSLPKGLEEVGEHAFYGCSSLTELTLPEELRIVGVRGFANCRSLKKITFDVRDLVLQEGAFENNASVENIYLNNIREIGPDAFAHSLSLEWIQLGKSVEYVYSRAFADCPKLTKIYSEPDFPPVITINTFDTSTESQATIYVPENARERYRMDAYWSRFNIVEEISDFPCSSGSVGIEQVSFSVINSIFTLNGGEYSRIRIFSTSGLYIGGAESARDFSISLEKGTYIVVIDSEAYKIVI